MRVTVVPVILSGGSGSRLWPLSREGYPKQFWPLLGGDARTMLQETASRAVGPGFAPPVVVCNEAHRFLVAEQLREARIEGARILLEPAARNSAPAIAAAALLLRQADPESVLWLLAADHVIADVPALLQALEPAVAAARAGRIVTFGMRPDKAETGYGYIETGADLPGPSRVHAVARFIEKPDAATAERLVSGGRHLWNSGMFVATAATLLDELSRHAPEVVQAVERAMAAAKRDLDFIRLGEAEFAAAPAISIDYAVMEKTERAAVVPASIGWSDIGSWAALWEAAEKDGAGNATMGPVELMDAERCYVR